MSKRDEVMSRLLDGVADKVEFDPQGALALANAYSVLAHAHRHAPASIETGVALLNDREST